jgi:hypothetical protein
LSPPPDRRPAGLPPGWPREVRPPGTPDWEQSASAWLFDLCPPDFRGYGVLRRHPRALARLAAHHVDGARRACAVALSSARAELGDLDARTLAEYLESLETEQARLLAATRSVTLVEAALNGQKYIPRL